MILSSSSQDLRRTVNVNKRECILSHASDVSGMELIDILGYAKIPSVKPHTRRSSPLLFLVE